MSGASVPNPFAVNDHSYPNHHWEVQHQFLTTKQKRSGGQQTERKHINDHNSFPPNREGTSAPRESQEFSRAV